MVSNTLSLQQTVGYLQWHLELYVATRILAEAMEALVFTNNIQNLYSLCIGGKCTYY